MIIVLIEEKDDWYVVGEAVSYIYIAVSLLAGLQKTYIGGYAIILFWLVKISSPLELSKNTI